MFFEVVFAILFWCHGNHHIVAHTTDCSAQSPFLSPHNAADHFPEIDWGSRETKTVTDYEYLCITTHNLSHLVSVSAYHLYYVSSSSGTPVLVKNTTWVMHKLTQSRGPWLEFQNLGASMHRQALHHWGCLLHIHMNRHSYHDKWRVCRLWH